MENDLFKELREKNKRLSNELLFAKKCIQLLKSYRNSLISFRNDCNCNQNFKSKQFLFNLLEDEYKCLFNNQINFDNSIESLNQNKHFCLNQRTDEKLEIESENSDKCIETLSVVDNNCIDLSEQYIERNDQHISYTIHNKNNHSIHNTIEQTSHQNNFEEELKLMIKEEKQIFNIIDNENKDSIHKIIDIRSSYLKDFGEEELKSMIREEKVIKEIDSKNKLISGYYHLKTIQFYLIFFTL